MRIRDCSHGMFLCRGFDVGTSQNHRQANRWLYILPLVRQWGGTRLQMKEYVPVVWRASAKKAKGNFNTGCQTSSVHCSTRNVLWAVTYHHRQVILLLYEAPKVEIKIRYAWDNYSQGKKAETGPVLGSRPVREEVMWSELKAYRNTSWTDNQLMCASDNRTVVCFG